MSVEVEGWSMASAMPVMVSLPSSGTLIAVVGAGLRLATEEEIVVPD